MVKTKTDKYVKVGELVKEAIKRKIDAPYPSVKHWTNEGLLPFKHEEEGGLKRGGQRVYLLEDTCKRLKEILRLKKEEFLPLYVIKSRLESKGKKKI